MRNLTLIALIGLGACADKDATDDSSHSDDSGATEQDVAVTFAARFGATPAACGQEIPGVGTTGSTISLQDLRFYVHDLRLVDSAGAEVPVTLDDDDLWQNGTVALLDFEDATGLCGNGTSPTNDTVTGVAPAGDYTGLRFTLGVPFGLNHADAAVADTPLNLSTMFWSWQSGYKFLRMDLSTAGLPEGWFVHLGSTGCTADPDGTVTDCTEPNRVEVALDMDVDTQVVVADFGALLAGSDVDADGGGAQGCMSGLSDPECGPVLGAFGLSGGPQVLFSAE
ncbi:MAG: metallo-mystery pair system four-Cys motif protein [Alphaproteobacteria bacterium]|nr:metallo-mystery pair system four-Cys motif protein [Alphaproteobacteria bacterium]